MVTRKTVKGNYFLVKKLRGKKATMKKITNLKPFYDAKKNRLRGQSVTVKFISDKKKTMKKKPKGFIADFFG